MLKNATIEELRKIFREEFGKELTFQEAFELGHNLVAFFDQLARLDHKDKIIPYQNGATSGIIQT